MSPHPNIRMCIMTFNYVTVFCATCLHQVSSQLVRSGKAPQPSFSSRIAWSLDVNCFTLPWWRRPETKTAPWRRSWGRRFGIRMSTLIDLPNTSLYSQCHAVERWASQEVPCLKKNQRDIFGALAIPHLHWSLCFLMKIRPCGASCFHLQGLTVHCPWSLGHHWWYCTVWCVSSGCQSMPMPRDKKTLPWHPQRVFFQQPVLWILWIGG